MFVELAEFERHAQPGAADIVVSRNRDSHAADVIRDYTTVNEVRMPSW
jgi:hypothetical protein